MTTYRSLLWARRLCAGLWYIGVSSSAFADEVPGALTDLSAQYEGYYYEEYEFATSGTGSFSVVMESSDFDSFVMLLAPDTTVSINDDHSGLENIQPANHTDAGIRMDRPAAGVWRLVATTLSPNTTGRFSILSEGIVNIQSIASEKLELNKIKTMFAARHVYNAEEERQRRIAELIEQLSLPRVRANLEGRLMTQVGQARESADSAQTQLAGLEDELQQLETASRRIAVLPTETKSLLQTMVEEKHSATRSQKEYLLSELANGTTRREALAVALDRLRQLNTVTEELVNLRNRLMTERHVSGIDELRSAIRQAQSRFDELARAMAADLLDSGFADELRLGAFMDLEPRTLSSLGGAQVAAAAVEQAVAVASVDADLSLRGTDSFQALDPSVWLPRLLPWPPPDASARLVVPTDLLRDQNGVAPTTLGEVDDILQTALRHAGYAEAGYLGVPTGYAIVTRLEQTSELGEPLDGNERWATSIVAMRRFSLTEYLRALLTAPPGHFRVLVLVISSEPFTTSGSVDRLEAIQRWSRISVNALPDELREFKYHDGYRVTVLVYEFLKRRESDQPQATVPGRLTARDHLIRTGLHALVEGG